MKAMTRKIAVLALFALFTAAVSSACPVCYGAPDSALTKGMNNGIIVLLGIIGFVQLGIVALFYSFWRRAQRLRKTREQFRLIEGGAS